MAEVTINEALKSLKDKIAEKIKDASSLEVVTFTGDFKIKANELISSGDSKFDIENVLNKMNVSTTAELEVVAYSIMKMDGDQANIVKSNLTSEQSELVKFHREMIEASQNSRKAIIEMLVSLGKVAF